MQMLMAFLEKGRGVIEIAGGKKAVVRKKQRISTEAYRTEKFDRPNARSVWEAQIKAF